MIMIYAIVLLSFLLGLYALTYVADYIPCLTVPALAVYIILAAWALYWYHDVISVKYSSGPNFLTTV